MKLFWDKSSQKVSIIIILIFFSLKNLYKMLFFTKKGMNGFHIKTSPSSLSSTNLSKNAAVQVLVYTLLF